MISVNGQEVKFTKFPDNTSSFRYDAHEGNRLVGGAKRFSIVWKYDNDTEYVMLWYLVNHIRAHMGFDCFIGLILPYIPNARMDRVKNADEVFTLKWFAEFINMMCFCYVSVLDPHSDVAPALINNVRVEHPDKYISKAITAISDSNLLLCYPDEGAAKRYSELMSAEYVFGIKHRDWRTGKIDRFELNNPDKVAGRNILIVDDICSKGGTFTHTAKALKEAGANDIYLYATHCENTIFNGSVLTDGLIRQVFTTDSIYRGEHDKITILKEKE